MAATRLCIAEQPAPKAALVAPGNGDRLGCHDGHLSAAPGPQGAAADLGPSGEHEPPDLHLDIAGMAPTAGTGTGLNQAVIHGQERRGDGNPARIPQARGAAADPGAPAHHQPSCLDGNAAPSTISGSAAGDLPAPAYGEGVGLDDRVPRPSPYKSAHCDARRTYEPTINGHRGCRKEEAARLSGGKADDPTR
jgi:hypothetical protein